MTKVGCNPIHVVATLLSLKDHAQPAGGDWNHIYDGKTIELRSRHDDTDCATPLRATPIFDDPEYLSSHQAPYQSAAPQTRNG